MATVNQKLLSDLKIYLEKIPLDKKLVFESYIRLTRDVLENKISTTSHEYNTKHGMLLITKSNSGLNIYFFTKFFGQSDSNLVSLGISSFESPLWVKVHNLQVHKKIVFNDNEIEIVFKSKHPKEKVIDSIKAVERKLATKKPKKKLEVKRKVFPAGLDENGKMTFRTRKLHKRSSKPPLVSIELN